MAFTSPQFFIPLFMFTQASKCFQQLPTDILAFLCQTLPKYAIDYSPHYIAHSKGGEDIDVTATPITAAATATVKAAVIIGIAAIAIVDASTEGGIVDLCPSLTAAATGWAV
ncbi:hypothetical protein GALMADRAFT_133797 [Galerina marginata CBS 339.88]|uniref:Uncharacterized protein n=1 Tax=Galerina marginata (strain CBS 339.88) TaxID=685588 RepID=A0A067TMZ9_GALM3|nr:hypothetical protein GALMADRAFT_133797 [Galerina marginata CBS 339.88]